MPEIPKLMQTMKTESASFMIGIFYYPILDSYNLFIELTEEAKIIATREGNDSEEYVNKLLEALDAFNPKLIQNFFNDSVIEASNSYQNDDLDKYFKENYPELSSSNSKYSITEIEIQKLRDKLFSFFRILNNELNGMNECINKIEKLINESTDLTSNLRGGLTGGAIGAVVGSILLPGIGTVAGAAAGGYLLNKNKNDKQKSSINEIFNSFKEHADHLINLLGKNAQNFKIIIEHFTAYAYEGRLNNIYHEISNLNKYDPKEAIIKYLKKELKEIKEVSSEKIEKENSESLTFRDWANHTHAFINNYSVPDQT